MRKSYRKGQVTRQELMESSMVSPEGCWEWRYTTSRGYGSLRRHGRGWMAHRISYFLFNREAPLRVITDSDQCTTAVCHRCDNRLCINPEHLYLGTQSTNMRDTWQRTRAHEKSINRPLGHNKGE